MLAEWDTISVWVMLVSGLESFSCPISPLAQDGDYGKPGEEKEEKREMKEEKKPAPAVPQRPMVTVYVNDRLGAKQEIPCYATDLIGDFKVIVTSMIGRKPDEIPLKGQGRRPFKDKLTPQNYGVSSNMQLELEVNTGD